MQKKKKKKEKKEANRFCFVLTLWIPSLDQIHWKRYAEVKGAYKERGVWKNYFEVYITTIALYVHHQSVCYARLIDG